eukprot:TRINITY_DN1578_c2_g1_i1.p1 TRINITY_DN1578_c2_g1~~TRINITY_DN1578_c2_g1_i1.p1  ORF type:complete len:557 (+),score=161.08 TRINITY_DN1578_c2_g1_i1:100-1671(+)
MPVSSVTAGTMQVPPVREPQPVTKRPSLHDLSPSDQDMFVVKDGMQYKTPLLLTCDWAVQPIGVLKAHVAPRWRTKKERLSIGCAKGRYIEQPNDGELCGSIGSGTPQGPTEIWLWPAEQPVQATTLPNIYPAASSVASSNATTPSTPTTPVDVDTSPLDVRTTAKRIIADGIMAAYHEDSDSLTLAITWAEDDDLVKLAELVPQCMEEVLQAHHPQLHAAVAELLNKVQEGPALDTLLTSMEECTGQLLEVPALFSATFSRMSEAQRARLLKRAVGFVLPFADRPRAGLALEACIRLQCAKGAAGGVAVVRPLLDEILAHCTTLMRSGSGNFLVQQCIQLAPFSFADSIAKKIKGSAESMSLHRHASHVVEQILKYVSIPVLGDMLSELVRSSGSAARLARSQSGNYVLQTAIMRCTAQMWDMVSTRVKGCLPDLPPVAAERIWARLTEKAAAESLPLDLSLNFQPAPKKPHQQTQHIVPQQQPSLHYDPPAFYCPPMHTMDPNAAPWLVDPSYQNMTQSIM